MNKTERRAEIAYKEALLSQSGTPLQEARKRAEQAADDVLGQLDDVYRVQGRNLEEKLQRGTYTLRKGQRNSRGIVATEKDIEIPLNSKQRARREEQLMHLRRALKSTRPRRLGSVILR